MNVEFVMQTVSIKVKEPPAVEDKSVSEANTGEKGFFGNIGAFFQNLFRKK